jgi:hypothetical protein
MRLIRTTRWSPYQCPSCAAKFQRKLLPSVILGGIGGGIGTLVFGAALFFQSVCIGVVGLAAWFSLLIWADWYLIPFREVEKSETKTTA